MSLMLGIRIAAALVLAAHVALAAGLWRHRLRDRSARGRRAGHRSRAKQISVVVTVKDEEQVLPRLLASLAAQTHQSCELVFVDDGSSDGTGELLRRFRQQHPERTQVLRGRGELGEVNPKQRCLDQGVGAATGEILLFTDGDCVLPPRWAEDLSSYFEDAEVGLVFGQLTVRDEGGWLTALQAFDLPLFQHFAAGSAGLGLATGSCGHNQAVRRSALAEVGGFSGLGYTLTEDTALVSALRKRGWKVRASTWQSTITETSPQRTLRELYRQRLRWMAGFWYGPDAATRWLMRGYAGACLVAVAALGLAVVAPELLLWPAALLSGVLCLAASGAALQRRGWRWLSTAIFLAGGFIVSQAVLACLMGPWRPALSWKGRPLGLRRRGAAPDTGSTD